jgi:hypothetical protein
MKMHTTDKGKSTSGKAELPKLRRHVTEAWEQLSWFNRTAAMHMIRHTIDPKIRDLNRELIFQLPSKKLAGIHDILKKYLRTEKVGKLNKAQDIWKTDDFMFQVLQRLPQEDIDTLKGVSKTTHRRIHKYIDNAEYSQY